MARGRGRRSSRPTTARSPVAHLPYLFDLRDNSEKTRRSFPLKGGSEWRGIKATWGMIRRSYICRKTGCCPRKGPTEGWLSESTQLSACWPPSLVRLEWGDTREAFGRRPCVTLSAPPSHLASIPAFVTYNPRNCIPFSVRNIKIHRTEAENGSWRLPRWAIAVFRTYPARAIVSWSDS